MTVDSAAPRATEAPPLVSVVVPARDAQATLGECLRALANQSLGRESYEVIVVVDHESADGTREVARAAGVPVLASRRGALAELFPQTDDPFAAGRGGTFFEPGDVAGLRGLVERLTTEPELLVRWMSGHGPVVGWEEHAEAIEAVYAEIAHPTRRL